MAAVRRVASSAFLFALVILAVMSGHREDRIELFSGAACKSAAACERNKDLGPAVEEMLADQVARFGPTCVDPAKFVGIPSRVLVRNARAVDGDTGVVRAVTLDEALAGAKAGTVYVLKACA
jgi:hypothetical protein